MLKLEMSEPVNVWPFLLENLQQIMDFFEQFCIQDRSTSTLVYIQSVRSANVKCSHRFLSSPLISKTCYD